MANEEHLEILAQGVEAWNWWRRGNDQELWPVGSDPNVDTGNVSLSAADLTEANLTDADLRDVNFLNADLNYANLSGADLTDASLNGANLNFANLSGANLTDAMLSSTNLVNANLSRAHFINAFLAVANFSGANLSGANFNGAHLGGANLGSAILTGTDFQNAVIKNTRFADCDLSDAIGLDLISHEGPSTIGLDTIYKSKGKIPESFLRGCGVPESFITQMRSLVGAEDGFQFYSCFISHNGKDGGFARRLHGRMRDAHLRVWFAPEDVQGGKKLHEQIETAIRFYDKLLVVLSEASLQSEWVMDELRKGFKAERDTGKRKLFPVRLIDYETLKRWECRDSLSGKDLAEEVRQYFIPDFSNWKDHDQFEAAFARLLKDLRAEERAK